MRVDPIRIFFSYSSKDRGSAATLCDQLLVMGMQVWFDKREIAPSTDRYTDDELKNVLETSIKASRAFLLLIDDHSMDSSWVQYELSIAEQCSIQDPAFQIISIINFKPKNPLPGLLQRHPCLDFSTGYKTALSRLAHLLNPTSVSPPRLDLQVAIAAGSRSLKSGPPFDEHLRHLDITEERRCILTSMRDSLANFDAAPLVTELVTLVEQIDSSGMIDQLLCGNLPITAGEPAHQLALAMSFLPTISIGHGRLPNMSDAVDLVMLSLWPSEAKPAPDNMSTLFAEFNQDQSAFLWLAHAGQLHRYTMGSSSSSSVLLSDFRKMGASPYAFCWPKDNPDGRLVYLRQCLANKLGLGQLQWGQEFSEPTSMSAYALWQMIQALERDGSKVRLTRPVGRAKDLWTSLLRGHWVCPEAGQKDTLLGHIKYGGLFLYDTLGGPFDSDVLAAQIGHVLEAAGATILSIPSSDEGVQYLSVSGLQLSVVEPYFSRRQDDSNQGQP